MKTKKITKIADDHSGEWSAWFISDFLCLIDGRITCTADDIIEATTEDYKKRMQESGEAKERAKANMYLTGGQAKLDKNKNNKLDAQDFKILRAEKAKGRGMGLQDESVKPGKVMKAKRGTGVLTEN